MSTIYINILLAFITISENHRTPDMPFMIENNPEAGHCDPFDVLINEIMARPSPPVGLPETEYIELFNRSDKTVRLYNWTISVGTRSRVIPEHIMMPGGFLLITHENNVESLMEFGEVAGMPAFPILAMAGQTITLRNNKGSVISAINYSDKWYGNNLKASGGWSLEQIDPFNPCGGSINWTASTSSKGGTPGMPNSVIGVNPDNISPKMIRASYLSPASLRLHFNEPMHPGMTWSPDKFYAEGIGHPLWVIPAQPFFDEVDLFFSSEFEEDTYYTVSTKNDFYDCAGNILNREANAAKFTIPLSPAYQEIIINEILFNPFPGGTNFVELVNNSNKTFDLKQITLAGITQGYPDPAYIIAAEGYLLFPGEYVVLTKEPEIVKNHYFSPHPDKFVSMDRIPQMNNSNGRVVITDIHLNIIDDLQYEEDMHSPLLSNKKGISLERISYSRPASDPTNWISASEKSGFATPGYKNSQYLDIVNPEKEFLSVDPKIFAPDNSGYRDVTNIYYNIDKQGYIGSITIFDSRGRSVRKLVSNELFGTSGVYSWDGRNEANNKARLGIYLILMELFHPDGDVRKYKEPVVLGGKFRQ